MASKRIFVVFILPVIFSIAFGSAVMGDILQEPGRELNMMPSAPTGGSHGSGVVSHSSDIKIIGLSKSYLTSEPVEVFVQVSDSHFDCGDLYITIYSGKDAVAQGGFFEQCFAEKNALVPMGEKFSEVVDAAGSYKITADMISEDLKNISISEEFTVK